MVIIDFIKWYSIRRVKSFFVFSKCNIMIRNKVVMEGRLRLCFIKLKVKRKRIGRGREGGEGGWEGVVEIEVVVLRFKVR